jgi:hypothetical protein
VILINAALIDLALHIRVSNVIISLVKMSIDRVETPCPQKSLFCAISVKAEMLPIHSDFIIMETQS